MKKIEFETPFLSIKDAARATGISEYSIRQGCINGIIPHLNTGKAYKINMPLFMEQLNQLSREGGCL